MDPYERTVLKRKRHTIASFVQLTDENVALFKKYNIINDYMWEQLQKIQRESCRGDGTNFQKMMKLLDLMPAQCDSRGFESLCVALESVPAYVWMAEELRAELKSEKGEIKVDDYINRESAILVFREFGSSKRLSEMEKKEIQTLVAARTQYAKEVWQRRLTNAQKELTYLRKVNEDIDKYASDIITNISKFVQVHKKRLKNIFPTQNEQMSTTLMLREKTQYLKDNPDKTILDTLKESVDELTQMATQSLLEKDLLSDERCRALEILGVKDNNVKIDAELEKALQKAHEEIMKRKAEADEHERKTKELEAEIERIKAQGKLEREEKEGTITKISNHLGHAHEKIQDYSDEALRLRRELDALKKDTEVIRKKAEILDRTRRLGYVDDDAPMRPNARGGNKPSRNLRDPKRRVSQPNASIQSPINGVNGAKGK